MKEAMRGYLVTALVVMVLLVAGVRSVYEDEHCPYFSRVTPPDPTASPYWEDPEVLPPNRAPKVDHTNLSSLPSQCPPDNTPCTPSYPYRTLSGRCNNPLHPALGASNQPLSRLLPPVYDEALMRTRGEDGCLLPNPRQLSLELRRAPVRYQRHYSTMFMQVGQFIDHDLTHLQTVNSAKKSGECGECTSWRNPICLPIPIPINDSFIPARHEDSGRRRCLPVVRSLGMWLPDRTGRSSLHPINRNTAFLDLSLVYGSDPCRGRQVRAYRGGLLRESPGALPPLLHKSNFLECWTPEGECFVTGDDRGNEQLCLTVLHTMYLREHNRIARNLTELNPHWQDERTFQEARRINIAQYQKMVYKEFLPHLIGRPLMQKMELQILNSGYYEGYDRFANPSLLVEFVSAAFRVGHAMIPNHFLLLDASYRSLSNLPLVPTFHNPSALLQEGIYDQLIRGMIEGHMQGVDLRLADAILHHLFENATKPFSGQDLMALNIARGREHALPPYLHYLNLCEGRNLTSFKQLQYRIRPSLVRTLASIYKAPGDIDLIVGTLAETTKRRTMVGPTMGCIIGLQFLYLKKGDRFWFENPAAGFTEAQLKALRSSTFGRVACDSMTGDNARTPTRVLQARTSSNIPKPCSYLVGTDLTPWKEEEGEQALPTPPSCATRVTFNPLQGWVTQTCN